jgi:hypothetical protein
VTWQDGLLLFLSIVDVSALVVGLTVLRRVTRLVRDAGEQIHESVMESIDEAQGHAVRRLVEVVAPVLEGVSSVVVSAVEQIGPEVRDALRAVGRREPEG